MIVPQTIYHPLYTDSEKFIILITGGRGSGKSFNASTFIFYMVILYSIINPLKDFSKASYNIPKGLASMERVDKILKAPNNITERTDA